MKSILSILAGFLISLPLMAQTQTASNASAAADVPGINWISIEEAWARNSVTPKKIFIDVYTNWCGWCKRMDETTFRDPKIVDYINRQYYAVKMNAESKDPVTLSGQRYVNPNPEGRRSPHELAALLLQGQMSYPSYVFLNEKAEKLKVVKGYLQTGAMEPWLHFFGSDAYLSQGWEQYQASFVSPK